MDRPGFAFIAVNCDPINMDTGVGDLMEVEFALPFELGWNTFGCTSTNVDTAVVNPFPVPPDPANIYEVQTTCWVENAVTGAAVASPPIVHPSCYMNEANPTYSCWGGRANSLPNGADGEFNETLNGILGGVAYYDGAALNAGTFDAIMQQGCNAQLQNEDCPVCPQFAGECMENHEAGVLFRMSDAMNPADYD